MPNNLWYKDCIIYSLHIRSFYDSDNNGIGDINEIIGTLRTGGSV